MYGELPRDVEGLCALCLKAREDYIDVDGKFLWVDGDAVCNISKEHKGRRLKDITADSPGFLEWILGRDFSPQVKEIATKAINGEFPRMD